MVDKFTSIVNKSGGNLPTSNKFQSVINKNQPTSNVNNVTKAADDPSWKNQRSSAGRSSSPKSSPTPSTVPAPTATNQPVNNQVSSVNNPTPVIRNGQAEYDPATTSYMPESKGSTKLTADSWGEYYSQKKTLKDVDFNLIEKTNKSKLGILEYADFQLGKGYYKASRFILGENTNVINTPNAGFSTVTSYIPIFGELGRGQTSNIAKFAFFAPAMVSAQTSLTRSIRAGEVIPESRTTFTASINKQGGVTRVDVISNTETLGQQASGVSQSVFNDIGKSNFIGVTKGYTLITTPKGTIATEYGAFTGSRSSASSVSTIQGKGIIVGKDTGFSSVIGKSFVKENARIIPKDNFLKSGVLKTNLKIGVVNKPLKVNPDISVQYGSGYFKLLNENTQLYRGSTEPNIRPAGVDLANVNVQGVIFKSVKPEVSFSGSGSNMLGKLTRTQQRSIGSQFNVVAQQNTKTIINNIVSPTIKTSPIVTAASESFSQINIRSESPYAGTGRYERSQYFSFSRFEQKDNQFNKIVYGSNQVSNQRSSLTSVTPTINTLEIPSLINPPTTTQTPGIRQMSGITPTITPITVPETTRTGIPIVLNNPVVPFIPFTPFIPNFDFQFDDSGRPSRQFKGSRRIKYTPDYYSLVTGRRGKAPSSTKTGLESRPITKGFSFAFGKKKIRGISI